MLKILVVCTALISATSAIFLSGIIFFRIYLVAICSIEEKQKNISLNAIKLEAMQKQNAEK